MQQCLTHIFNYSLNILFIIIHLSNSCAEISRYNLFVLSLEKKNVKFLFKKTITLSQLATWFNRVYISISAKKKRTIPAKRGRNSEQLHTIRYWNNPEQFWQGVILIPRIPNAPSFWTVCSDCQNTAGPQTKRSRDSPTPRAR